MGFLDDMQKRQDPPPDSIPEEPLLEGETTSSQEAERPGPAWAGDWRDQHERELETEITALRQQNKELKLENNLLQVKNQNLQRQMNRLQQQVRIGKR